MMSLVTMGGTPGSEEGVVPNSSLPGEGGREDTSRQGIESPDNTFPTKSINVNFHCHKTDR